MKVLITGIMGFVGSHLTFHLQNRGWELVGIDRSGSGNERLQSFFESIGGSSAEFRPCRLIKSELSDIAELATLFAKEQPDAVIHLAGNAFVPDGWLDPCGMVESNTMTTIRLLQAARESDWRGRFLYISSSDIYGQPEKMPIDESTPARPESPYASSKLAAEELAAYFERSGIELIVARPFNHIGPGQRRNFVVPSFLERILKARQEGETTLSVGDLDSGRDFTDVRDVVEAYRLLLEKGQPGTTYNICSGRLTTIRDILDLAMRVADVKLTYEIDPTLLRPEGSNSRYGCSARLQAIGWKPRYTLEESIRDTYQTLLHNGLGS